MKTTFIFYMTCELLCVDSHMKTFTCPVGLNFTIRSGYKDPMDHTPCYFMMYTQPWHKGLDLTH